MQGIPPFWRDQQKEGIPRISPLVRNFPMYGKTPPHFLVDWRDLTYQEKCERALAAADGTYELRDADDVVLEKRT